MSQNNIILIGAGGNSRVVISCCLQMKQWNISGIIDTGYKGQSETIMGIDVLGGVEKLADIKSHCDYAFVTIGDNEQRKSWYENVCSLGFKVPSIISPHAYVDPTATLGKGNLVCPYSHIGPECTIGNNTILNTHSNLEHESSIGDHCHLAPSATTGGRCNIGNNVLVGTASVLLPKIHLSQNIIIGANSLVTTSLTASGTYVGSPVRKIQ